MSEPPFFARGPLGDLMRHGPLIGRLAARRADGRVRGAILGSAWLLLRPLLLLAVYTLVFGIFFERRWSMGGEGEAVGAGVAAFAVILFAGIAPFHIFSEIVTGAPGLPAQSRSFITKLAFPSVALVYAHAASQARPLAAILAVLLIGRCAILGPPGPLALAAPIALVPLALWAVGLTFFLAALGPYLRDIEKVVSLAMTAALFLSAIFYPVERIPESFAGLAVFNPILASIDDFRALLIFDRPADWTRLVVHSAVAAAFLFLARRLFIKLAKGFADVL